MNELSNYHAALLLQLEEEKGVWREACVSGSDRLLEELAVQLARLVREIRRTEKQMGIK